MVLAGVLGTSMSADAFFAAFRLPNFLRRMFAEGSLTAAFIPVFSEVQTREGRSSAFRLAVLTLNWLILILSLICIACILFAPQVVSLLTPGWIQDPVKFSLTVRLTRIMFPYILLISMTALAMGVLNAQGHFASPALAPAALNVVLIVSALLSAWGWGKPALGLAVGVLVGGLVQVLMQLPPLWKRGFRWKPVLDPKDPHLCKVGRLFLPSFLGSAVYQVNMVVLTVLASLLPQGSLSALYYADRLVQFPLGVFAIAVGTAALPALSRRASEGDMDGMRETFVQAFRHVGLIMIPSAVGLIVLREPIMAILFQRGRFDWVATHMSAQALFAYGVGLWFVAELRVLAPAFYALKDTTTPMKAAVMAILLNLLFSLLLMRPLGHAGLALALSLSATCQWAGLLWRLRSRLMGLKLWDLFAPIPSILLASTMMGLFCWFLSGMVDWSESATYLQRVASLVVCIFTGGILYAGILYALGLQEARDIFLLILRKVRGGRSCRDRGSCDNS
jgi:putative peptidoglycan lipid II flippase